MSSSYPAAADNPTNLVDGIDYEEAKNVNYAYDFIKAIEAFLGVNGKGQSWTTDILDYLINGQASILKKASVSTLTLDVGAVGIAKSDQSNRLLRRITSLITIDSTYLDTGSMAVGYYDVFVIADSAATTFTVKFCVKGNTPSGATNYEKYGWFYNETAGVLDVTNGYVGNYKRNLRHSVRNSVNFYNATDFSTTSTSYVDVTNSTVRFCAPSLKVRIYVDNDWASGGLDEYGNVALNIDGSDVQERSLVEHTVNSGFNHDPCVMIYEGTLAAETTVIKLRMKTASGAYTQHSTARRIIVEEI